MLLVKRFNKVCEKYPYTSQGLVSGVLSIAGDFIAQKCIEKKEKFDFKRSFNFMVIGYFTGIALRKWYGILELKITNPKPFVQAASKVLGEKKGLKLDCTFFKLSSNSWSNYFRSNVSWVVDCLVGLRANWISRRNQENFPSWLLRHHDCKLQSIAQKFELILMQILKDFLSFPPVLARYAVCNLLLRPVSLQSWIQFFDGFNVVGLLQLQDLFIEWRNFGKEKRRMKKFKLQKMWNYDNFRNQMYRSICQNCNKLDWKTNLTCNQFRFLFLESSNQITRSHITCTSFFQLHYLIF